MPKQALIPLSYYKDPGKRTLKKHYQHKYYHEKKKEQKQQAGLLGKANKQGKKRKVTAGTKRFQEYVKRKYGENIEEAWERERGGWPK